MDPKVSAICAIKRQVPRQTFIKSTAHQSCVAQRKRAGLITRRTSDRNRPQLIFCFCCLHTWCLGFTGLERFMFLFAQSVTSSILNRFAANSGGGDDSHRHCLGCMSGDKRQYGLKWDSDVDWNNTIVPLRRRCSLLFCPLNVPHSSPYLTLEPCLEPLLQQHQNMLQLDKKFDHGVRLDS
ncbi:hypothetical protein B0T19DRAFT_98764 [Cercophora scortea]|uniref:Uncharacterized protein n=1 Tax=Cercophora scortea TaxID=314031 RepID=A0AAE0IVY6_9PEZI|nr:hypothetical protein B0T19DRAFT_98764 [Cercophora scortea]